MGYEIVKSIKIENGKVMINGSSNNVRPHDFHNWECESLTETLQEQGLEALDIEILLAYESGEFQRGSNKYTRALQVLRHLPEYADFDWRKDGVKRNDKSAFYELLKKALNTKLPKSKFIIKNICFNGNIEYLHKMTTRCGKFCMEKTRAKVYKYREDAEKVKNYFNLSNLQVEQI